MRLNKKGGIADIFIFMIVAFILAISCVIFVYIGNIASENIMAQNETIQDAIGPGGNATEILTHHLGNINSAYSSLRWITTMLIIGMILAIIINAFLTQENPVFFVLYVFLLIIAIVVSIPLSNAYEVVYSSPVLSSSFVGFWGQTYIFLNLPYWVTAIGFLAGIIMFVNMVRVRSSGGVL
jgi:hypothetical protein